jgi:hypothetical protein
MKWWHWLVLELLIIFGVISWIYFFPGEIEDDFAKGLIGFVLIYAIDKYRWRNKMSENYTVEQNAGENQIEGGVVSISGSTKIYTCKDCLRHPFCYLAKERNGEACSKISLYEETEKQYQPFKDCIELIECYQKKYKSAVGCDIYFPSLYKPCIWVKSKAYGTDNLITAFDNDNESIGGSCVFLQDIWVDMKELFDNFTFLDGSPCGKEE